MSRSPLSIITVCVSLVLVLFVVIPGCTVTPPGSEGTNPVTSLPSITASPVPVPTTQSGQSAGNVQLVGNVYGLSSDPLRGIDTITFSLGLPANAPAVDLTRMEIVFSTPGNAPVTFTRGTREATGIFTTTTGGYAVTTIQPGDEVDISFRVKPVPGGTSVNIEVRPSGGAALPISRTVPAMILSMNVLD
jgi:archaellin